VRVFTYYRIKLHRIPVLSPHNEAVGADLISEQIEEQEPRHIGRSMHCFFIAVSEPVPERQWHRLCNMNANFRALAKDIEDIAAYGLH